MASITIESPAPAPEPERLSLESIPTVDLRLLSQSELTALSLCSTHAFDLRRCDDVVIPKIDRSVFNESAGSRKQTYSRLRLAPRKPDLTSGPTAKPRIPALEPLDSERADNSRIIALFKHLFNSPGSSSSDALVPVNIEYSDALPAGHSNVAVSIPVYGDNDNEFVEKKRKRGRKPKSETMAQLTVALIEDSEKIEVREEEGEEEEEEEEEEEVEDRDIEGLEEREKELLNKNGVIVDLMELAKLEDPYGPEIRRRTEGRQQLEELLGFMTDLKGQWGSRRRKRKIVDANEFGDALPNGWKVLIAMKKKQGHAWLFCRRYISPTGRYFLSCKEVSSYLLSLTSPQDLKQQSSVQCIQDSLVDNKLASENVVDVGTEAADLPSAFLSSGLVSRQTLPCISQTMDHEKQLILSPNVHPSGVQSASSLKCHKCSTPFTEKDGLLKHLISCHKRKRRKAGAPIEDDVMMKDGMYECQFCNKMFHERSSYFGHVGIHVKNYVKSMGGSLCASAQKTCDLVSIGGFAVTVSDTLGFVEANADSVAGTPIALASSEPSLCYDDSKLKIDSDAEPHLHHCNRDQDSLPVCPEMNMEAAQNDKAFTGESFDKQDAIFHANRNKTGEVDKPVYVSTVKPDFCAGSEKVLSNENNDVCGNSSHISAPEGAASEMSCSPSVPMVNAEADLLPKRNQVDLGNNCNSGSISRNAETNVLPESNQVDLGNNFNSGSVSGINCEGIAPGNIAAADSEEKSLSNQKLEDRSLGNNVEDSSNYDEEVKDGSNGELMDGSGSIHFDLDMDLEDDSQHTVSMKEFSVFSHKKEETCDITNNKIGFLGSILADSKIERSSETSSPDDQRAIGSQNMGEVLTGMINESEVDMDSFERPEVKADDDCSIARARQLEVNGCSYIGNDSGKVPLEAVLEPQQTGGFQVEQTCSLVNSTGEVSSRMGEELKSEQVTNSSNLFFTSRSSDTPLDANVMTNNELGKISVFSRIPSTVDKVHGDISNVLGAYNNFVDKKQEQNPKSTLSGVSSNENVHKVNTNNLTTVSAGTSTMQLPELDKVDNLRTNKLILDFGSMTELNGRFLNTGQHETVPEGSSPFSIWGEPTCVADNRTSVYGSARGVDQQERASENNALNFVGLQRPCDEGYNLNKVCMNEQRYGMQVNETGLYRRSSDSGREGISHGNTLSLAGLQPHCDAGYNLNKPCQQNFSVQHSEAMAFISGDEARRERVTYGNSLSLASVQQTCDTGYSLNKACVQGLSKLGVEHSQDMDLMIGFGNNSSRPNQGVGSELLWRATEGNILSGSLMDSASSQAQSSGFFQAFDFLSDKSGNDLCTGNEKFDNVSSFEGLRSTSVEPMEFSFLTTQDSNAQLEDPKVLSYNTEMDQGFGSSVWHQKGTSLPNMMGGHVISTLCVWCGNEFHQDSLACEIQAGSIGYLCPTCKARMSGQYL